MPVVRVQAVLQRNGLLPEDVVVNTWHFQSATLTPEALGEAAGSNVEGFYGAIQGYLSDLLSGGLSWKAYNIEDAEPRVPVAEGAATITPGGGTPLPAEIASVLSYRAEYVSGEPNARRRGRIFLGPLNASSIEGGSGRDMLLDADHMSTVTTAAEALRDAAIADNAQWVVFSPTIFNGSNLIFAWAPVIGGWMDNALDVIRSRGGEATTRVNFGELAA